MEKVVVNSATGCLEYTGYISARKYPVLRFGDGFQRGNRLVYKLAVGNIPEGLCVLHKCDNPKCLNPKHLFLGTHKDNNWDAINKGRDAGTSTQCRKKTHCLRGHAFSGRNLRIDKNGSRVCRKCRALQAKRERDEKKRGG